METILTTEQRKLLLARHRNERDKRVADRIKAVLLRDEGMSYRAIARVLFLTDEGARQQVEDFLKKNGKLEPENGGSEARLSDEQTKRLEAHLEEKLYVRTRDIIDPMQKSECKGSAKPRLRHTCDQKPEAMLTMPATRANLAA